MNTKIEPSQLQTAITDIISKYTQEVGKGTKEDVLSSGKACVEMVQAGIDAAGIGGKTYRKSFKSTTTKDTAYMTTVEIHSPKHYRLTHLLEHGHVVKNKKGEVIGASKAFPHLAPAEKEASDLLVKKIKLTIGG